MYSPLEKSLIPPFRSLAVALLFCVFLGPVGLLYASLLGGTVMIVTGLFILRAQLFVLFGLIWLASCIWGVAATQRYNQRIVRGYSR